jgi:hypothetical protein
VIKQLIEQILLRGTKTPAGSYTVTFGILFQETADIFDALVGILKTAKKYSVLSFNKDQLWQGKDDAEVITLLKHVRCSFFRSDFGARGYELDPTRTD